MGKHKRHRSSSSSSSSSDEDSRKRKDRIRERKERDKKSRKGKRHSSSGSDCDRENHRSSRRDSGQETKGGPSRNRDEELKSKRSVSPPKPSQVVPSDADKKSHSRERKDRDKKSRKGKRHSSSGSDSDRKNHHSSRRDSGGETRGGPSRNRDEELISKRSVSPAKRSPVVPSDRDKKSSKGKRHSSSESDSDQENHRSSRRDSGEDTRGGPSRHRNEELKSKQSVSPPKPSQVVPGDGDKKSLSRERKDRDKKSRKGKRHSSSGSDCDRENHRSSRRDSGQETKGGPSRNRDEGLNSKRSMSPPKRSPVVPSDADKKSQSRERDPEPESEKKQREENVIDDRKKRKQDYREGSNERERKKRRSSMDYPSREERWDRGRKYRRDSRDIKESAPQRLRSYYGDYVDDYERPEDRRDDGRRNRIRRSSRDRDRDHDSGRDRERERRRDGRDDRRSNRDRQDRKSSSSPPGQQRRSDRNDDRSTRNTSNQGLKNEQPPAPATGTKSDVPAVRQPTLGAYIPPAKLRMMQNAIQDKSSATYQRLAWEALKKSLNGLINKVNISNISVIVRELFKENLIRGRGILCRSVMQAQTASPTYTNVFAALVAIINTKFPNICELLLKRLILQFRRGYKRNDKTVCLSAVKFIAHLVNQQVAHEVLALELLTLLLEHPTAHSVEVAIAFLKEVGARLDEVSPRGAHAIFESLRRLLHEGMVEKRVQYMIEVMFQLRKDKYDKFPAVPPELDLVEEEDQFTHMIMLDDEIDTQDTLNIFKMDTDYLANEEKYAALRKEILDESEEESGDGDSDEGEDSDEEKGEDEKTGVEVVDKTETNLLSLRRTIYLTIQSSLDYEECCHKLLRTEIPEGQESELCHMILDCCAQQRTYEKFFGLLAQRFCSINMKYVAPFEEIFKDTYDTVHRLDTNKLRNVAKFFAHLLFTDAISWTLLEHIRLTEDDTTSSSRIFVKILCQELSEYMGLTKLNDRFNEKTLKPYFEGLFPRDDPKNTRFSINFFTSIGLGGLTDELREHLKPKSRPEV